MDNVNTNNFEYDETGYRKALHDAMEQEYDKIKKELDEKLVITVMGMVNAGKSTLLNQLLDEQRSSTSPVPGWTKDVSIRKIGKNVVITDTPGLEDVNESVANKTLEHLKTTDIILYVFPSQPGITKPQIDSFHKVLKEQRPTLAVFNVFFRESLEPNVLDQMITTAKSTLNFTPFIDISAKSGYNVDRVEKWTRDTLHTQGKELLWAKITRKKDETVKKWILHAALEAAKIEFSMIETPISIPDVKIKLVIDIQARLIIRIASAYGEEMSYEKAEAFVSSLIEGVMVPNIFGCSFIDLFEAVKAGIFTYILGMVMKEYFKSRMKISIDEIPQMIKKYHNEAGKYIKPFINKH